MIIIYNLGGLIVGVLGLAVGVILVGLTRKLSIGFLELAVLWCWLGRSKVDADTQKQTTAPSIFFIPLFYWGILAGVCTIPAVLIDIVISTGVLNKLAEDSGPSNDDSPTVKAAKSFRQDEMGLSTNETDDVELSSIVASVISDAVPKSPMNLRIKSSDDSVLILVKLSDLKKVKDAERLKLLNAIRDATNKLHPELAVYIGIKGKLMYGAILKPNEPPQVASAIPQDLLYGFYRKAGVQETDEPAMDVREMIDNDDKKTDTQTRPDREPALSPKESNE